jgi:hypothetical protein
MYTLLTNICFCTLLIAFGACTNAPNNKQSEAINLEPKVLNMEDPVGLEKALKMTQADLIKSWGKPIAKEQFKMNESLEEFRIELYNYIPKETYLSSEIVIDELTWEKDSTTNITFWYRNKDVTNLPIHYLIWQKDVEF